MRQETRERRRNAPARTGQDGASSSIIRPPGAMDSGWLVPRTRGSRGSAHVPFAGARRAGWGLMGAKRDRPVAGKSRPAEDAGSLRQQHQQLAANVIKIPELAVCDAACLAMFFQRRARNDEVRLFRHAEIRNTVPDEHDLPPF